MTRHTLTVDAGLRDLPAADHLLHTLAAELALPEGVFGCTHLIRDDRPRVTVSLTLPSQPLLSTALERLAGAGHEVVPGTPDDLGRAVLFPGAASMIGTLTIAELLSGSAIDRVTVLGAQDQPAPDTRLVTRDHVRPQWTPSGELVLTAMPAVGDTLVPFEVPDPTPCCADH